MKYIFDTLYHLDVDNECDGQTDGRAERPLSIARSNTHDKNLKISQSYGQIYSVTRLIWPPCIRWPTLRDHKVFHESVCADLGIVTGRSTRVGMQCNPDRRHTF